MNNASFARTAAALVAGAALFLAVSRDADAQSVFNVSTTITASCNVTDAGPTDLTPTYSPLTDSGTGSATALNTFCTGTAPTATFTDAYDSFYYVFAMTGGGGGNFLYYQISNNTACTGVGGDDPINEGSAIALPSGTSSFNICAAVITGGMNAGNTVAGTYGDTVTYSIAP